MPFVSHGLLSEQAANGVDQAFRLLNRIRTRRATSFARLGSVIAFNLWRRWRLAGALQRVDLVRDERLLGEVPDRLLNCIADQGGMLPLEAVLKAPGRRDAAHHRGCAERLQTGVAVLLLMYSRALLHAGGGPLVHADVAKIVRITARAGRKLPAALRSRAACTESLIFCARAGV